MAWIEKDNSPEYLWYRDIDATMFSKLKEKNTKLFSKNANIMAFTDYFVSNPDAMGTFITKKNGISTFKNALWKQENIVNKRFIILNFLLSRFTSDFQKNYILSDGFTIDSIKLIYRFQKENNVWADGIFWEQSLKILQQLCNVNNESEKSIQNNKDQIQLYNDIVINKIEKTHLDECAQYVTQSIMKLYDANFWKNIYTTLTWVIWNAWTMYNNITRRAWWNLGNIFSEDKPNTDDPNIIKDHVKKLYEKNKSSIKEISWKVWDVVWLFYPKSSNHVKANNECTKNTCNTHVWYIRWFTKDWTPIVSHNIHWTIRNQPIDELYDTSDNSNWCVVRWARPNILASLAYHEQKDQQQADKQLEEQLSTIV